MKVEVIAKRGFGVTKKGSRAWLPGEHAKVLVSMGIAEYAPVQVVPAVKVAPKGTYQRRDMVAEPRAAEPKPATITKQSLRPRMFDDDGQA